MSREDDTRRIANALIGTADSIQLVISRLDLADKYDSEVDLDTEVFDSIVFCCEQCNWWCGMDECNDGPGGQWVCEECSDDRQD